MRGAPGKRRVILALAGACFAAPTLAADIKVLTAGALKSLVVAVAPEFERQTGNRLVIEGDTAGGLTRRVLGGEAFDLVIVTQEGIDALARQGKLDAGTALPLARIGIGVAVREGAPKPDIRTVDDFRRALLGARAVAYIDPAAGGSSGIYLSGLFERMGIADQIHRKAVLVAGGLVAQRLVDGQADIALQQVSELHGVPGVTVLGPIPEEIQHFTTYVGAVGAASTDKAAARALIDQLRSAPARRLAAERGMKEP
jgi:molybdate transport system substrate-binding protein